MNLIIPIKIKISFLQTQISLFYFIEQFVDHLIVILRCIYAYMTHINRILNYAWITSHKIKFRTGENVDNNNNLRQ